MKRLLERLGEIKKITEYDTERVNKEWVVKIVKRNVVALCNKLSTQKIKRSNSNLSEKNESMRKQEEFRFRLLFLVQIITIISANFISFDSIFSFSPKFDSFLLLSFINGYGEKTFFYILFEFIWFYFFWSSLI